MVAQLSQQEAAVIRGLVSQIKDMLTGRSAETPQDELAELTGIRTGPTEPPEDKVLERLLPDFFRTDVADAVAGPDNETDENSAGALRSLHEPELVQAKTEVADLVLNTCPVDGGAVQLTGEQADQWLTALNDVRLALGTALEVGEDGEDDLVDDAETDELRREHLGVYHWLTWVQDNLVTALVE